MNKSGDKIIRLREEVINVKLAELLSSSGFLSVPESILNEGIGKRIPDVIIGNYWGVRVIIEGRINDASNIQSSLNSDCVQRIEEDVAALVIGVIYPPDIRVSEFNKLGKNLLRSDLRVKVFSEAGNGEWIESDFEGLSGILRRAYESLVHEDVVIQAVEEITRSIDRASDLINSPGTAERLQSLLVRPFENDEAPNDE